MKDSHFAALNREFELLAHDEPRATQADFEAGIRQIKQELAAEVRAVIDAANPNGDHLPDWRWRIIESNIMAHPAVRALDEELYEVYDVDLTRDQIIELGV